MPDVNVLVDAHRQDETWHQGHRDRLDMAMAGPQPFGLSMLVAVGFVRVVTNPRIYADPTPLPVALSVVERLTAHPRCRIIAPRSHHLDEVARLCRAVGATGKHVADAQHAAVAIAEGASWVTRDDDFARFAHHGLHWRHLVLG